MASHVRGRSSSRNGLSGAPPVLPLCRRRAGSSFRACSRYGGPIALAALLALGLVPLSESAIGARAPTVGERPPAMPVVLVPGVTGVELRNRETEAILWGRGRNLLRPRDLGYSLAGPLDQAASGSSPVVAGEVIESISLGGIIRKQIYGPIVRRLEEVGYRKGDLQAPRREDSLFLFAYDWRDDNVRAARQLAEGLEEVRRVRGVDHLPVVLLCQSNGAHICRYLVKHGGRTLEEAEAQRVSDPPEVEVKALILVGTSNGGALRILREMNRGRRYLYPLGRKWAPEVLFTFASLYQDLPVHRADLFLDGDGKPIDVDLFDARSWRRYGWSVFSPQVRERLAGGDRFGDEGRRIRFLERMLERSLRFHRLLGRDDVDLGQVRYYLVRNTALETPARAVMIRRESSWETLFSGDRALARRPELRALTAGRGDGHATVESQMWLSAKEAARLAEEPLEARGRHFEMILHSDTLAFLVRVLAQEEAGVGEP